MEYLSVKNNISDWLLQEEMINISTRADGGPRSRVCARETLRSAPH